MSSVKKPAPARKTARKKTANVAKKAAPARPPKPGQPRSGAWTLDKAMRALEKAGTAQNRKIYARHGVGDNQFGVSFAAMRAIAKTIGTDHDLAQALWAGGNHDARILATMIGDAGALTGAELDRMAKQVDNYIVTDAFAGLAANSPHAAARIKSWIAAKPTAANEFLLRAGYSTASANLMKRRKARPDPAADLPDALLADLLARIESSIHQMPNRTREAMNSCLISIGSYREGLRDRALAAARKIGHVDVDHGLTGCKTPDASAYIAKTVKRK